jgi:hypothetical protein
MFFVLPELRYEGKRAFTISPSPVSGSHLRLNQPLRNYKDNNHIMKLLHNALAIQYSAS